MRPGFGDSPHRATVQQPAILTGLALASCVDDQVLAETSSSEAKLDQVVTIGKPSFSAAASRRSSKEKKSSEGGSPSDAAPAAAS